jgi:hypothetical protein
LLAASHILSVSTIRNDEVRMRASNDLAAWVGAREFSS